MLCLVPYRIPPIPHLLTGEALARSVRQATGRGHHRMRRSSPYLLVSLFLHIDELRALAIAISSVNEDIK